MLSALLMRTSFRQLAGFGVGGGVAIIGGALCLRQWHLQSSPVVEAAVQQIVAADAVRHLLGSSVASTSGVFGGYTDPIGGTACITMPVVSEDGVRAIARVEAEAEWLIQKVHAEARGENPAEPMKSETCRWLLRHLEVQLEGSPEGSSDGTAVLYSLPCNTSLSPWAPSRAPSLLPRWLRSFLPEPAGVVHSEASPRLLAVGVMVICAHATVFGMLHRRMINEKMFRRAEQLLALPDTVTHNALARRALEIAVEAVGPASSSRAVRTSGTSMYGQSTASRVLAFTSLDNHHELFFKAERAPLRGRSPHARRSQQPAGEEWTLTHVSMGPTDVYTKRLATLPADADEVALLETILSVEARPLDTSSLNRQVVVPVAARVT